jgi:hypothetical protein
MEVPAIRISARVVLAVGVGKGPHAPGMPDVNLDVLREQFVDHAVERAARVCGHLKQRDATRTM